MQSSLNALKNYNTNDWTGIENATISQVIYLYISKKRERERDSLWNIIKYIHIIL